MRGGIVTSGVGQAINPSIGVAGDLGVGTYTTMVHCKVNGVGTDGVDAGGCVCAAMP